MSMTFATDVVVNNGNYVQTNKVLAPTTSGGSTYGAGSNGQVLTSSGSGTYWETPNAGTVTGVKMNNGSAVSPDASGVVDLGTVITAHQDISGKVSGPSSATNNAVAIFNGTGGKAIKNSGFTIGKSVPSDAVFTDTTYSAATTSDAGLMSAADKTKLDGIATGATANVGTITGIKMNGSSKGTSGVVDLGTVITSHQDISGKVSGPSSATNNAVAIFDGTGGKKIKNSGFTIGKSVPSDAKFTDTTYSAATTSTAGLMSAADKTKLNTCINTSGSNNQRKVSSINLDWSSALGWHLVVTDKEGTKRYFKADS